MKFCHALAFTAFLIFLSPVCGAQADLKPQNATTAVLRAFDTHDLVLLGEIHGNKQEYEWLRALVASPEFSDRVDDIVVESGNSLYQKSVDRYISGEDVPLGQVQRAWRNTVGAIGPPSPVYASLYQAVRESNLNRTGKHQIRVVCGDPYIDWAKVKDREDIAPYLGNRDQWFTQIVKDQVLAKHHHALLIMAWGHFLRGFPPGQKSPSIEQQLRSAGASTYLIVLGTNAVGGYDNLDHRFDSWPAPAIVSLADGWVGELPALAVLSGGTFAPMFFGPNSGSAASAAPPPPLKLKDAADALLYLGPRDALIQVRMPRAELDGTPYGEELQRRLAVEGFPSNLNFGDEEVPQFARPQPQSSGAPPPPMPPPPKNMGAPLPPRPPSE